MLYEVITCLGLTKNCLDALDQANKKGMKVNGEFYPYTFASSSSYNFV